MDYRGILGNLRGMHHKRRGVLPQVPCLIEKDFQDDAHILVG